MRQTALSARSPQNKRSRKRKSDSLMRADAKTSALMVSIKPWKAIRLFLLAAEQVSFQAGDAVEKQKAIQVVQLVLNGDRLEPFGAYHL